MYHKVGHDVRFLQDTEGLDCLSWEGLVREWLTPVTDVWLLTVKACENAFLHALTLEREMVTSRLQIEFAITIPERKPKELRCKTAPHHFDLGKRVFDTAASRLACQL